MKSAEVGGENYNIEATEGVPLLNSDKYTVQKISMAKKTRARTPAVSISNERKQERQKVKKRKPSRERIN